LRSRRAMIPPTRPAISRRALDAPLCELPRRATITPHPTISPMSPPGSKCEPQTGYRSPIGSAFVRRAVRTRLALQTFETRHGQTLLAVGSRQVRVAGIARTDRSSLAAGAVRPAHVQASLGIDRRRDPPRPAITIGFTSNPRRQVLSPPGHGLQAFPSVCWVRAEGRGLEPPNIQIRSGRHHRAGGATPVEARHRPRSQNQ
jgi:hypothetical protein